MQQPLPTSLGKTYQVDGKQKITETKLETDNTGPFCPPLAAGSNLYLFFSAVEEEMKINDKIQTQTIKQNERPPTN